MENPGFGRRMLNCCKVHWNGYFYFFTPVLLLPLIFIQPHLEFRTIYIMLWSFIWYASDTIPAGVVGLLPIIFFPILGLMSSQDVCMVYARDSQMVFMLSVFVASVVEISGIEKHMAFFYLDRISCNPKVILMVFMVQSYIMSIFIPDAVVCSLMMPLTKGVLQMLENISVAKQIDETREPKDDESPFNSKVSNAFYIGIAYAANIGGMATIHSADVGVSLQDLVTDILPKSSIESKLYLKYVLAALPVSLLLLTFTIMYLEFIFLGFLRHNSAAAQEIAFDWGASKSALKAVQGDLPPVNSHMIMALGIYLILFIKVAVLAFVGQKIAEKILKYSFNLMAICYLYFIMPRNWDFCNYFICRKPNAYKTAPSMLTWAVANKAMPWNYFFVYGSSLAFGLIMNVSGLYKLLGQWVVKSGGTVVKQIGLLAITTGFTILGANHLVSEFMLKLGAQAALNEKIGPALMLWPVMWGSCISFLLPISSVANCFASGWGRIRPLDMMFASLGPTLMGLLLAMLGGVVANAFTLLKELAY